MPRIFKVINYFKTFFNIDQFKKPRRKLLQEHLHHFFWISWPYTINSKIQRFLATDADADADAGKASNSATI
jgi:hypothetical protein